MKDASKVIDDRIAQLTATRDLLREGKMGRRKTDTSDLDRLQVRIKELQWIKERIE